MTLLYKDNTNLQSLYTGTMAKNKSWQKIDLWWGVGRGYRRGITQNYFLKNHKTKKGETLWL